MDEKKKEKSNEETVTIKANVTLKKSEYEKLQAGEIKSNKGLRSDDGKLSSIADFEEIKDDDYPDTSSIEIKPRERSFKEAMVEEVVFPIVEVAVEKATEAVVDATGKAITYVWNNAIVPTTKKGANAVLNKAKEIKANHQNKKQQKCMTVIARKQTVKVVENTKTSQTTVEHTPEEVDMIIQNMRYAAIVLAASIRELSNTIVVDSNNPEKSIEVQRNIERLSSKEAMSIINYMLEDQNRELLDEASRRLFEEFRNRNLIIEDEVVPMSRFLSNEINSDL